MLGLDFFPDWVRITHLINIVIITFLMRSGLQIFSAFPRLYHNDGCRPGTEWLKLTRSKVPPTDPDEIYMQSISQDHGTTTPPEDVHIYTSLDEELDMPVWLSLPGHKQLGLGRSWHFLMAMLWVANGIAFTILMIATGYWHFILPTSWSIFPEAGRNIWTYLHWQLPQNLPGQPFDAIQKLSYLAVIFILGPLQIATGIAMSPAVVARFPHYLSLFGGRQMARSIHFIVFVLFVLFVIVHTVMVFFHGFVFEAGQIIWGVAKSPGWTIAIAVIFGVFMIAINVFANWVSLRHPHGTQDAFGAVLDRTFTRLFSWQVSEEEYPKDSISPYFWVNGHPPVDSYYQQLAKTKFASWKLIVSGLVEHPLSLSLDDLRQLEKQTQITKHNCIQGWSGVAEWGGVCMSTIMELCHPMEDAHYVVFHAMDNKSQTAENGEGHGFFYETLNIELAWHPQAILAYEMNDAPLSIPHGAPLRLRCETELGFKMVKWLGRIDFVKDYQDIGEGQGGWREDYQYYDHEAGI